jgi:TIR domain
MKVFLSHASADKPVVRRISDALTKRAVNVWLDEVEIRVGESIPARVAEGLDESNALLLAYS